MVELVEAIQIGDPAPDFTLKNQHGEDVTLSSFRGESAVVLVFFPFAFSNICTGELAEIRDDPDALHGAEVLAVSCDHFFANRAFADAQGLEFSVLSDFWPHGDLARAYGIFNDDVGVAERGSYVIDRHGIVRWTVEHGIGEARDLGAYREALAGLDQVRRVWEKPCRGGARYALIELPQPPGTRDPGGCGLSSQHRPLR